MVPAFFGPQEAFAVIPRRYRVFAWAMPVVVLNWLLIAFVQLNVATGLIETIVRHALAGTLFGITTVAAAWTAFGPMPFAWRLPLALMWVVAQSPAIAINGSLYGAPRGEFILVGILLLSQWLLLQMPLWGVAIGFGVHLIHAEETGLHPSQTQFGIRQLMIVTAIVAVLFGVGRIIIPYMFGQMEYLRDIGSSLAFLVFWEVVLTLPLVVAALLRRNTLAGVAIALGIFAAATAGEIPLMRIVGAGNGPGLPHIIGFNIGAPSVMLVLLSIIRLNGYSLARIQRANA
jgi:hypothetical protein